MKCVRCSNELRPGARFCGICGKPASASSGTRELDRDALRELADGFIARLRAREQTRAVCQLILEGEAAIAELRDEPPSDASKRLERVQAFADWQARVTKELRS